MKNGYIKKLLLFKYGQDILLLRITKIVVKFIFKQDLQILKTIIFVVY